MKRPKWHRQWSSEVANAKLDVIEALEEYPDSVTNAALVELLADNTKNSAKRTYAEGHEE